MKSKFLLLSLLLLISNLSKAQTCTADFTYEFDAFNPASIVFTNTSIGANLTYQWNMGEGTTINMQSLRFNFTQNKSYEVCLFAQSSTDTSCQSQICKTITIKNYNKCKSMYYFERDSLLPKTIQFFQNSQGDSLNYLWAFGDGTFSIDSNPAKSYSQNGNYTVCLTTQRPSTNGSSIFCSSIAIGTFTNTCRADMLINEASNQKGYTFRSPLVSPPYQRCSFDWDLGDGNSFKTNHIGRLNYQYQDAGSYLVCLQVTDTIDRAFNKKNCQILNVSPLTAANKCTAKFSYLKLSSPLSNLFSAYSNYATNEANYYWTFGDGDTSNLKNPSHTYKENGIYTICLNVKALNDTCSQSYCETHSFVDPNVGIQNILPDGTFKVYPNPISDKLNVKQLLAVELGDIELFLTDQSGRVIFNQRVIRKPQAEELTINLHDLCSGMYFLQIRSNKGNYQEKLIKY